MAYATRSWIETQFQNFSNRITAIFAKKKDVGNGTITIKQAGISKGTFTTNQSGNTTIELTDNNTTYSAATQSANGLMYAADKKKLDGIEAGANKTTYTNNLAATVAGTALDAVQGKVLNDKIESVSAQILPWKTISVNITTNKISTDFTTYKNEYLKSATEIMLLLSGHPQHFYKNLGSHQSETLIFSFNEWGYEHDTYIDFETGTFGVRTLIKEKNASFATVEKILYR